MKTSELTGAALDWAVAKCEGFTAEYEADIGDFWIERTNHNYTWLAPFGYLKDAMHFSTNWSQGGPIIEREGITVSKEDGCWSAYFRDNLFEDDGSEHWQTGPAPLIAAMRCYVASKLGDDVEIPAELK